MKNCTVFGSGKNIPSEIANFLNVPVDKSLEFTFDHGVVNINGTDQEVKGYEQANELWVILQKYYNLPPLNQLANVPIVFKMNIDSIATVSYTAFLEKVICSEFNDDTSN
jgi:hypothetical protein